MARAARARRRACRCTCSTSTGSATGPSASGRDAAHSHPFRVGAGLYADLRDDALRFFSLMRSGTEIVVPGYERPAGHPDTAVPAWTGPDAQRLYPGWHDDGTYDVSGGWYDAGDYGKYVTSGAIAVWQLLGTLDLLPDRADIAGRVPVAARLAAADAGAPRAPAGRAGVPPRPRHHAGHRCPAGRTSTRPNASCTARRPPPRCTWPPPQRRAHGTSGSIDPAYAHRLEVAARSAYDAARLHPDLLAPDDHARHGGGPYDDSDVGDDLYWAAAELWLATGDHAYEVEVLRAPEHASDPFDAAGFDFDAVSAPARLDLALHGDGLADHDRVVESLRAGADRLLALQAQQPWGQPYAPADGWGWGSNGRILNNLVVLGVAHLVTGDPVYRDAVATGTDYLLGRNALGPELRHRLRHRPQPPPAHPPVRPRPRPGDATAPARRPGGRRELRPGARLPVRPRLVGLPPQSATSTSPRPR